MSDKDKPGITFTKRLLSELSNYGKPGGAPNSGQLRAVLNFLYDKQQKYDSNMAEDKTLQALYNYDPSRLKTFYGLGDYGRSEEMEALGDPFPYLSGGSGAAIDFPEKILKDELPIYRANQRSRTGQILVGKYVRGKDGQRRPVYFPEGVVNILNQDNMIK